MLKTSTIRHMASLAFLFCAKLLRMLRLQRWNKCVRDNWELRHFKRLHKDRIVLFLVNSVYSVIPMNENVKMIFHFDGMSLVLWIWRIPFFIFLIILIYITARGNYLEIQLANSACISFKLNAKNRMIYQVDLWQKLKPIGSFRNDTHSMILNNYRMQIYLHNYAHMLQAKWQMAFFFRQITSTGSHVSHCFLVERHNQRNNLTCTHLCTYFGILNEFRGISSFKIQLEHSKTRALVQKREKFAFSFAKCKNRCLRWYSSLYLRHLRDFALQDV